MHKQLYLAGVLAVCGGQRLAAAEAFPNWQGYQTTMWVGDSAYRDPTRIPLFFQRMREMGVNSVTYHPGSDLNAILTNHFGFYVENIVNRGLCLKWNSTVIDWDKFVTKWTKAGRPESAFVRDYSLEDPQWRSYANKEITEAVTQARSHKPFAYDIRDELSVTISANPFDYDFSPPTLAKFHGWLRTQYRDLAALNEEWETKFASWDEIKPFTTDQIKNRMASGEALPHGTADWQQVRQVTYRLADALKSPTRWNFSPWADFRTFLDSSLADALNTIRKTAHEIDPATPVGIEGTQMPSAWGGYDLWRLSQSLDWVEPYDVGNAREIFGSFMPRNPSVTTVFEKEADPARRRLWHLLLEGDRGCLIWWSEDCIDWKSSDYALTAKAKALAPVMREMTTPLAQIFGRAEREYDPIAIHYSQASIQVDWLLESIPDGATWYRRFSSFESEHNRMAKVRNAWLKAFQDLGFVPRFVSSEQIEQGELTRAGYQILILPETLATSGKEKQEIGVFGRNSRNVIFADAVSAFDSHGKLEAGGASQDWQSKFLPTSMDVAAYAKDRLAPVAPTAFPEWISKRMTSMQPEVALSPGSRTLVHRFKLGDVRLLAFERNIDYQMSEELRQAGGNQALEESIAVEAKLKHPGHVYNLQTGAYLGHLDHFSMTIDPWRPSLFAVSDSPLDVPKFLQSK